MLGLFYHQKEGVSMSNTLIVLVEDRSAGIGTAILPIKAIWKH